MHNIIQTRKRAQTYKTKGVEFLLDVIGDDKLKEEIQGLESLSTFDNMMGNPMQQLNTMTDKYSAEGGGRDEAMDYDFNMSEGEDGK